MQGPDVPSASPANLQRCGQRPLVRVTAFEDRKNDWESHRSLTRKEGSGKPATALIPVEGVK
jgi:hypothetical protein